MEISLDSHCSDGCPWNRIAPLLPGKEGDPGRTGEDNRRFLEGVFWVVRTDAPWRDLPNEFENWFSVLTAGINRGQFGSEVSIAQSEGM